MKKRATDSVSLIEMIMCIAFFAISCAIIFQMFAVSVTRSMKSDDLTWATVEAQSFAETIKEFPSLTGFVFDTQEGDSHYKVLYFDADKQPAKENGVYCMELNGTLKPTQAGKLFDYTISVKKHNQEIFALTSCKYFKQEEIGR